MNWEKLMSIIQLQSLSPWGRAQLSYSFLANTANVKCLRPYQFNSKFMLLTPNSLHVLKQCNIAG